VGNSVEWRFCLISHKTLCGEQRKAKKKEKSTSPKRMMEGEKAKNVP
jgi:hypothetical protein